MSVIVIASQLSWGWGWHFSTANILGHGTQDVAPKVHYKDATVTNFFLVFGMEYQLCESLY